MKTYILAAIVLFLALSCGYLEYKVQKLKAEKSSLEYELTLLEAENKSLLGQVRASNILIIDNNKSFEDYLAKQAKATKIIKEAKVTEIDKNLGMDDETRKQVCSMLNNFD